MDATHSTPLDPPRGHSFRELVAFTAALVLLESIFFSDALRPGWVLSGSDWLLASESFREPDAPDYDPANRLLTDPTNQYEPWMQLAADEWHAGRVPLWNPLAGCGAPLAGNAQSAVFFPIHFIYFATRSPYAFVVMAMLKLFVAGVGSFLFAREVGLGRLGRWFTGLAFPFSGFVVVWLQYSLASGAIWLPLLLWLIERLVNRPSAAAAGHVAIVVALVLLAGHPETAAHVLIVAGSYFLWRVWQRNDSRLILSPVDSDARHPQPLSQGERGARRGELARVGWFAIACVVGFLIAAVQLLPLAEYLRHGVAWSNRARVTPSIFTIRRPDWLAIPPLALPYVYGSYLRGHPHVEKALGVENFNEVAGGYTGLATIALLAPAALLARRRHRWVGFWIVAELVSIAVIYHLPGIDNLVRLLPVLSIAQNQRLLLVIAWSNCLLGGAGLESLSELFEPRGARLRRALIRLLSIGAVALVAGAIGVRTLGSRIERRAIEHFELQAQSRGLPPDSLHDRAERFAAECQRFFPRYYGGVAAYAAALAGFLWWMGRCATGWGLADSTPATRRMVQFAPSLVFAATLVDLFLFGRGYNPEIPLEHFAPNSSVTNFLRDQQSRLAPQPFRVLPMEEEFPPNSLARFGIADVRNYDCIESRGVIEFLEPLWPSGHRRRTSNTWVTWDCAAASLRRLEVANVRFLISTNAAPAEFAGARLVHEHGRVHIYELESAMQFRFVPDGALDDPDAAFPAESRLVAYQPGVIEANVSAPAAGRLVCSETLMPGWRATVDGKQQEVAAAFGALVSVRVAAGEHRVRFEYLPTSFRVGMWLSVAGAVAAIALLLWPLATVGTRRTLK